MSKQYLTSLAFATLLCMMLFGAVSCKKDDTPDPNNADFFIDVDFLPESETNGEVAPRLMANFNDEMVMIELRPSADALMETMLFLCPDNEAMMICGNDSLMICAAYDMETYTPSRDLLLVTPMDDNALLLTKCFMDWNTNTMITGDMMVLPIDDDSKSYRNKGGNEEDMRIFFMNRFMKPLVERFEKMESIAGGLGLKRTKLVFSTFRYVLTTSVPIMLFSDDPELLMDYMEYPFVAGTAQGAQSILLRFAPKEVRGMASSLVDAFGWFTAGGYGTVHGSTGTHEPPLPTFLTQANTMRHAAPRYGTLNPMFIVNLNVSNVTENSAYLKGSYYSNSSITALEMGYIIKVSDGSEFTEYDMNFNGTTISGLQKGTKYTANAYVKNMGQRMLSPGVTFWTLGFETSPISLTFPAEGDTKYVELSYSKEDITDWDITGKPSWCTITKDSDRTFAVTVDASIEARSGTITITAHSNALGNVTENIEVTQLGTNSWEGTSWVFTGMVTTNDFEGSSSSNEVGFTLMVNSVPNNIEFSYAQILSSGANGYSDNYVIDGNGKLVYNASATYSGEWGSNHITSRVTFTRTGSTTATADLQYRETFSNYVATMSGLLQGTLIRADEVGNYETTINLKTPVFDNKALKNK
jgi:hypothetical protein